jgi:glycosyltransferase involved in cell wall biosynthesis
MKILLVADGRSPITRGWVQVLQRDGWETTLVSTFPCQPVSGVREQIVIPVAFSSMAGSQAGEKSSSSVSRVRAIVSKFRPLLMAGRYWIGPLSLAESQAKFLEFVRQVNPDVVHALRIPFEGMLAQVTPSDIPFLVSIWGNDLTLHAKGSPLMARETRRVLQRADGLLADAQRDLRLGKEWGLRVESPTLYIPGGGGMDLKAMQAFVREDKSLPVDLPQGVPVIINPRGFRPGSVRNDTFFKAIPLVLKEIPEAIFICAGMAGQPEALDWIKRLGIDKSVRLLPFLPQEELWRLFKHAHVSVSISQHDGTPNSLLEAMALGCFPVAGEIESIREWIVDGVNGFLVEPAHAPEAAEMIIRAIRDSDLLINAAKQNREIIRERADKSQLSAKIGTFYEQFIKPA